MWSRISVDLSIRRAALEMANWLQQVTKGTQGEIPHLFEHVGLRFAKETSQIRSGLIL